MNGVKSTIKKYNIAATLDGDVIANFSLEALGDPDRACERFLDWFLRYRSAWFDLAPEDIDPIKETRRPADVPEKSDADYRFLVDIKGSLVIISLFPIKFII